MSTQLSGRSLDAAIAEKVMGFERRGELSDHDFGVALKAGFSHTKDGEPWHIPRYSESIEAAMQVLVMFPVWNINKTDHPDFADRPFSVAISVWENEHASRLKTFEVQAASIPEGVCRAALAAIEGKS